jgi:FlaA1/EpsC-like NDP-sugar epimerase
MKHILLSKNFIFILLTDVLLLAAALYFSFLVRFDFNIPPHYVNLYLRMFVFVLITKIACFYFFDLYRGMWRYTSIADLLNIIKSSIFSTLLIISFILLRYRFVGFPRSVFLIDWCLTILFISGFRLCVRLFFEHMSNDEIRQSMYQSLVGIFKRKSISARHLLIIGAGDGAEKIYREIRDNARLQYRVVGFLDDNPVKIGKKIHGIPVLGTVSDIKTAAQKINADEALIAIPSANSQQMRRIVDLCNESGIHFQTIPGYGELINGKVTVNSIREVAYRDLLGREAIQLDQEKIGAFLKGQRVLVTGAGGSIGSELCRQICRFSPQQIFLFERAESPLYDIQLELERNFEHIHIVPILADAQDRNQLERFFSSCRPQIVFHAAAYKHVPMLELQPWRAIDNNILGTQNLVETAIQHNIERFVFVSTDKAVRPTNVMGATKRVSEMLIQAQNACHTSDVQFMIVRFGNVVGSVGSVVPLFKKQIEKGGPVTVTHPDVTRYFMTIPESCQLILQAGAMGKGGEIFILDMGTPIKIVDMARDLIRLSGFEPDDDIKIEFIGLRPGEKLYEELITQGEGIIPTDHEKILVLNGMECNLDILQDQIQQLSAAAKSQETDIIIMELKKIVPEYKPANHKNQTSAQINANPDERDVLLNRHSQVS